GIKLKQERFPLDIRRNIFTMKTVKHWNRLHREAMRSPSV
ncbi:hypothetical protein N323_06949, partial [Cathartes aura]